MWASCGIWLTVKVFIVNNATFCLLNSRFHENIVHFLSRNEEYEFISPLG